MSKTRCVWEILEVLLSPIEGKKIPTKEVLRLDVALLERPPPPPPLPPPLPLPLPGQSMARPSVSLLGDTRMNPEGLSS